MTDARDSVLGRGLPAAVERTALFLVESGHLTDPAIAMAINLVGEKGVPHAVKQAIRRHRSVTMTPQERESFANSLQTRRVLVEGTLMSLSGGDVREGAVLSAHALCEARQSRRPLSLTIGGARAQRPQILAARQRLESEIALHDELMEAAVEKNAPKEEVLKQGVGGGKPHPRVVHLQNKLNSMGHRVASDGNYGPVTREAVKDFQAKAGIPPSGEVDEDTMSALRHGRVMRMSGPPGLLPQSNGSTPAGPSNKETGNDVKPAGKPAEQPAEKDEPDDKKAKTTTTGGKTTAGGKSISVKVNLGESVQESKLSTKERDALPTSAFVFPKERAYPIHDRSHAKAALSMGAAHESGARLTRIRAAVHARYPDLAKPHLSEAALEVALTVLDDAVTLAEAEAGGDGNAVTRARALAALSERRLQETELVETWSAAARAAALIARRAHKADGEPPKDDGGKSKPLKAKATEVAKAVGEVTGMMSPGVGKERDDQLETMKDAATGHMHSLRTGQSLSIPLPEGSLRVTHAGRAGLAPTFHVAGGGQNVDPDLRRGNRQIVGKRATAHEIAERVKAVSAADQAHTDDMQHQVAVADPGQSVHMPSLDGHVATITPQANGSFQVAHDRPEMPSSSHATAGDAVAAAKQEARAAGSQFLARNHSDSLDVGDANPPGVSDITARARQVMTDRLAHDQQAELVSKQIEAEALDPVKDFVKEQLANNSGSGSILNFGPGGGGEAAAGAAHQGAEAVAPHIAAVAPVVHQGAEIVAPHVAAIAPHLAAIAPHVAAIHHALTMVQARVDEARSDLALAEASGDGDRIVRARARVGVLARRLEETHARVEQVGNQGDGGQVEEAEAGDQDQAGKRETEMTKAITQCERCGAPVHDKVCQRGHRQLEESWAAYDAKRPHLSRAHYEHLASAIHDTGGDRQRLAKAFGDKLVGTNEHFDRGRFERKAMEGKPQRGGFADAHFTRQHFQMVADTLKENGASQHAGLFADRLAGTNSSFNRDRFLKAAGATSLHESHSQHRVLAGGWKHIDTGHRGPSAIKGGGRKITNKVSKNVFEFKPTLLDFGHPRLKPGDHVRLTHLGQGVPPPGTMGQYHVAHPETGELLGMVSGHSLHQVGHSEALAKAPTMQESAQTPMLSVTHAPIGKGGTNWVTKSAPDNQGQLPAYIQNIRNAIMRDGTDESAATAIAIGRCKDWAEGKGGVTDVVKAAAAKAVAEFEAMRGKSDAKSDVKKVAEATAVCPECGMRVLTETLVCERGHRLQEASGKGGFSFKGIPGTHGHEIHLNGKHLGSAIRTGDFSGWVARPKGGGRIGPPKGGHYIHKTRREAAEALAKHARVPLSEAWSEAARKAAVASRKLHAKDHPGGASRGGGMKVPKDYFDKLSGAIKGADTPELRDRYKAGDFPRSDAVKDLDKRYRWDHFWSAQGKAGGIPDGLNDEHIDTALRRIVPPLGKK